MRKHLVLGLLTCMFLPMIGVYGEGEFSPIFIPQSISQKQETKVSWSFWKDPKVIKEEQHNYFLRQVIAALRRPEIWNDPFHLLNILLQFEKFPETSGECHNLLIIVIKHRVVTLTMSMPTT
ncbi:hypothetical protein [Chlamydia vaughanii]|uniref:hypothetical protein n=1 Tax=Chlamydia vaughanii TaxID=3112552 RepID=UPI0032B1FEF2